MKENWLETLWNEEIRRCVEVDIAKKMKKARMRRYRHVIRTNKRELVTEPLDQKLLVELTKTWSSGTYQLVS